MVKPTATKTVAYPLPKINVNEIMSNKAGMDQTTLINQSMISSVLPPVIPRNSSKSKAQKKWNKNRY